MKLDAGDSSCPLCGLTLQEMAEFGSTLAPGQAAAPATASSSGPDLAALDEILAGELEKLLLPALERPDPTLPEYAAYKFTEPDILRPPMSPTTPAPKRTPELAPAGAAPLGDEEIEEELLEIEALGVNLDNLNINLGDLDLERLDTDVGDLDFEESEGEQGLPATPPAPQPPPPRSGSLEVEVFEPEDFAIVLPLDRLKQAPSQMVPFRFADSPREEIIEEVFAPEDFAIDVPPARETAPPEAVVAGEGLPESRLDNLFTALSPKPPRGPDKPVQDEAPAPPDAEPPLPPGIPPEIARLERALHNESLAVRKQAARKLKELILREYGSPQTPLHPDAESRGPGPLAGGPGPQTLSPESRIPDSEP